MRSHGLPVAGELLLSRAGVGRSNLTYAAADEDGHRWIVRRPPEGELLASAHDVEREYGILAALGPTAVPVPTMHCLLERGVVADVPVLVMEHVDGDVVTGFEGLRGLRAGVRAALVSELATVLGAIHAVDVGRAGLDQLSSHAPYAPRQLKRWLIQWERSRTRDLPALDALAARLRRNAPPQLGLSLLHGDYSPHNLIVDPGSGSIRAVLDWELSTLGDPLADVGTVLAYWTVAELSDAEEPSRTEVAPAGSDRAAFLQTYLEARGADDAHVAYWHALGLWKLAIITDGVIRRSAGEAGDASGPDSPSPAQVERLVEVADRVADRAGLL